MIIIGIIKMTLYGHAQMFGFEVTLSNHADNGIFMRISMPFRKVFKYLVPVEIVYWMLVYLGEKFYVTLIFNKLLKHGNLYLLFQSDYVI